MFLTSSNSLDLVTDQFSIWKLARHALSLIILLAITVPTYATVYSVGPEPECTHTTMSGALAAAVADGSTGPHIVRIRSGERVAFNLEISSPAQDIHIVGGFASCSHEKPALDSTTILTANDIAGQRIFNISNALGNPRREVRLIGLQLTGGNAPPSPGWGGAIYATGRVDLVLQGVFVNENQASNGGGIGLFNVTTDPDLETRLILMGVFICGNQATGSGSSGNGGGIYALGGTRSIFRSAVICENSARNRGGGTALMGPHDHLTWDMPSGATVYFQSNSAGMDDSFVPDRGFGGAIYTQRGNIGYAGNLSPGRLPHLLFGGNYANFGGAIYAEGGANASEGFSSIRFRNTIFAGNSARGRGGAIRLRNAVDFQLTRWTHGDEAGKCVESDFLLGFCSALYENVAENESFPSDLGAGGVAFLDHDIDAPRPALRMAGTLIVLNQDPNGATAAIEARGSSSLRLLRNVWGANFAGGAVGSRAMIASHHNILFAFNTVTETYSTQIFHHLAGTEVDATGSIFHSPGVDIIPSGLGFGTLINNGCMLSHTDTGVPSGPGVIIGEDPLLENLGTPRPGSPAIDVCDQSMGDNFWSAGLDALGRSVPVHRLPEEDQILGPVDLGAIEARELIDAVFQDRFELP